MFHDRPDTPELTAVFVFYFNVFYMMTVEINNYRSSFCLSRRMSFKASICDCSPHPRPYVCVV